MALYCSEKITSITKRSKSQHNCNYYCLNCLHLFRTKHKLESVKKVCEDKDIFNVLMPSEGTKILKFNQYGQSDKAPFIIYADLESLIVKIDGCKNNPEK